VAGFSNRTQLLGEIPGIRKTRHQRFSDFSIFNFILCLKFCPSSYHDPVFNALNEHSIEMSSFEFLLVPDCFRSPHKKKLD